MKTVILKQRLNLSFNESFAEDESQEQVRYFFEIFVFNELSFTEHGA